MSPAKIEFFLNYTFHHLATSSSLPINKYQIELEARITESLRKNMHVTSINSYIRVPKMGGKFNEYDMISCANVLGVQSMCFGCNHECSFVHISFCHSSCTYRKREFNQYSNQMWNTTTTPHHFLLTMIWWSYLKMKQIFIEDVYYPMGAKWSRYVCPWWWVRVHFHILGDL